MGILRTVKTYSKRGAGGILRTVKTYSRGEQGNPEDCQSRLTCQITAHLLCDQMTVEVDQQQRTRRDRYGERLDFTRALKVFALDQRVGFGFCVNRGVFKREACMGGFAITWWRSSVRTCVVYRGRMEER